MSYLNLNCGDAVGKRIAANAALGDSILAQHDSYTGGQCV
jgi:hypothetical protein